MRMTQTRPVSGSACAVDHSRRGFHLVGLVSRPASAAPHGARLSRDLADRVAAGREDSTSVIVSGTPDTVQGLAARYGARIKKSLRGGAVLEVTGGQLAALSQDPDVDHASGDVAGPADDGGDDGVDRRDAGVGRERASGLHRARVSASRSSIPASPPTRRFAGASSPASTSPTRRRGGRDQYGHGTHVAGIVAGSDDGGYAGVAPGAHIVSLRVLGADGSGDTSDVINAIDWAVDHRGQYAHPGHQPVARARRARVVSRRSAVRGRAACGRCGDRGRRRGRELRQAGGRHAGRRRHHLAGQQPRGADRRARSTRSGTAQRSDDRMATYSSRGPTLIDHVLKPEMVAPGNKIVATAAAGSYLAETYPERVVAGQGANPYMEMSGTSMSSAVVAGRGGAAARGEPAAEAGGREAGAPGHEFAGRGCGPDRSGGRQPERRECGQVRPWRRSGVTEVAGETVAPTGLAFGLLSWLIYPRPC